jgi:anti-sigma regulatory factor (Ser/Thr protein kinase)
MADEMSLEIPADAAYAVTARRFIVTATRALGLPDGTVEDLRLAASELVANAVEAGAPGPIRFALVPDGSEVSLEVSGTGALSDEPLISRRALLEGLFDAEHLVQEPILRIRVPAALDPSGAGRA